MGTKPYHHPGSRYSSRFVIIIFFQNVMSSHFLELSPPSNKKNFNAKTWCHNWKTWRFVRHLWFIVFWFFSFSQNWPCTISFSFFSFSLSFTIDTCALVLRFFPSLGFSFLFLYGFSSFPYVFYVFLPLLSNVLKIMNLLQFYLMHHLCI